MTHSEKIAAQVALLPDALKALLDTELAGGNTLLEVEFGRAEREGQVALILERPFRQTGESLLPGVLYRETKSSDRQIFEFVTRDERFTLAYVRFKPMVLTPLPEGPPIPSGSSAPLAEPLSQKPEVKGAEETPPLPVASQKPKNESAAQRFIGSMTMTFDSWHDGTGYDLEAFKAIPPQELLAVEALLIAHAPRDWRDIEALARIDSLAARQAIEAGKEDKDPQVRREAARYSQPPLAPEKREDFLLNALKNAEFFGGLREALEEVEAFHPPRVIEALLRGALNRDGEVAVHFAAMLYFLHGKSREPFEWSHRPFFLRFHTTSRKERTAVFRELCETIGVDASLASND